AMAVGVGRGALVAGGPARAGAGAAPTPRNEQVDRVTCEEFLALDPADQERIAYWVDGYRVAKADAAVGTTAFEKCGQPIGMLVEDCKATPKETLWQKVKKPL